MFNRFVLLIVIVGVISGCGPTVLTVDDAMVGPHSTKLRCVAYVEKDRFFGLSSDVPGKTVTFRRGSHVLGSAVTDRTGRAELVVDYSPDEAARIVARTTASNEPIESAASIFTWSPDKTIVVLDLDNTIVRPDYDKLVLKKIDEYSFPLKGSRRALDRVAGEIQFLYVTARPRFLLEKTRVWLEDQEYPSGPVIPSPGLREAIRRTEYKVEVLGALRREWPNLLIGIGNSESDRTAYTECGLLALLVNQTVFEDADPNVIRLRNWRAMEQFFTSNHALLSDPKRLGAALHEHKVKELLAAPPS